MTLYEVVTYLKGIALTQPNVRTAEEGNIYDFMNANPSIKYGVFFITQGTHREDERFDYYNFSLFYVDRLLKDLDSNSLQIQSIGKDVIHNIVKTFVERYQIDDVEVSYTTFEQKFADECAGCYAQLTLPIIKDYTCEEEY